ncbi:MAG: hypothetical protein GY929_11665 [Actinomycetia bacterium]|nr:hypothetical protein [Actinomycetes bacterium]
MGSDGRGRVASDDGTTLAEVTLALGLMSIVALSVAALVAASSRTDVGRTDAAIIRIETTIALDRISGDIREADGVGPSAAGSAGGVLHLVSPSGAWVEWRVTQFGLERRRFDGSTTSPWALEAAGLETETGGGPFVAYRDRSGSTLDPNVDGAENWAACTTSVSVVVRMPEFNGDDVLSRSVTIRRRALLEQAC